MAMNFHLTGRLARDPELRFDDQGRPRARLTVASDRDGRTDRADFFDVTVFGDNAQAVAHGTKGDPIALSGEARQNVWEDNTGTTHYDVQFVARNVCWMPPTADTPTATTAAAVEHDNVSTAQR